MDRRVSGAVKLIVTAGRSFRQKSDRYQRGHIKSSKTPIESAQHNHSAWQSAQDRINTWIIA